MVPANAWGPQIFPAGMESFQGLETSGESKVQCRVSEVKAVVSLGEVVTGEWGTRGTVGNQLSVS